MKNLLYISLSLLTIYGCNNAISTTSGESKKQKSAKEFAIQNLELSKSKMNQELTNSGLPTTDILNEIYLNKFLIVTSFGLLILITLAVIYISYVSWKDKKRLKK